MCVIVYKPKGSIVKKMVWKKCWRRNPHGAGMMFVTKKGHLAVKKGYFSFETWWKDYKKLMRVKERAVVVHFRWANRGAKNVGNCHPFLINDSLAFAHNGTIEIPMKMGGVWSDTHTFNRKVLTRLPEGFIDNEATMMLIEDYIGKSKLVFMDVEENVTIVNEEWGEYVGDVWFSNMQWEKIRKSKVKPMRSVISEGDNLFGYSNRELDEQYFGEPFDGYDEEIEMRKMEEESDEGSEIDDSFWDEPDVDEVKDSLS